MKFTSTLLALGLATGVISSPTLERRDGAAIAAAIGVIAADITQFNTDINAYNGGPPDIIQADSDKIVADTKLAITVVTAQDSLSLLDISLILTPITDLSPIINQAIDDLIAKKDLLVEACAGEQVLDDLNQQLATATTLADSVTERVPENMKELAGQLSTPILAGINKGITAFTGIAPCVTSTTSTSEPTATTTASPTNTEESTTTTDSGPSTTPSATDSGTPTGPSPTYPPSNSTSSAGPSYPTATEGGSDGDDCSSSYVGGPSPTYGGSEPYPTGGEGQTYPPGGAGHPYPTGGQGQTYPPGGEGQQYPTGGVPPYPTSVPSGGSTLPPITNSAARLSGPIGVIIAIAAIVAF